MFETGSIKKLISISVSWGSKTVAVYSDDYGNWSARFHEWGSKGSNALIKRARAKGQTVLPCARTPFWYFRMSGRPLGVPIIGYSSALNIPLVQYSRADVIRRRVNLALDFDTIKSLPF